MTAWTKTGTLTKDTTTGAHNQTFSSIWTEAPKVLFIWASKNTSQNTFLDGVNISFGYSDGTTSACITQCNQDNVTTQNSWGAIRSDAIIDILDDSQTSTGASLARASVSSWNSTDLVLNWSVAVNATQYQLKYYAIGGSDISNAKVINSTSLRNTAGTQDYTGFGFNPAAGDIVFALGQTDAITTGYNSIQAGSVFSFGAATSSSNHVCSVTKIRDAATTNDTNLLVLDNSLVWGCGISTADTVTNQSLFSAWITDGVRLNHSTAYATTSIPISLLIVKGGAWDIGTGTQRSGTGTQDITLPSNAYCEGLMVINSNVTTINTGIIGNINLSIGAGDGTNEGNISWADISASDPMATVQYQSDAKIINHSTANATAASSTVTSDADLSSIGTTAGIATLNWTTAGAGARYFLFISFGVVPNYVSQTSIQKYNLVAYASQTNVHKYHIGDLFLDAKVGIITKDTTTGAHTQNFTTELGFRPSAMIFWTTARTATGVGAGMLDAIGITDGTNQFCGSTYAQDNTNSGSRIGYRNMNTRCIVVEDTTAGSTTTLSEATVTFQDAGFDIEWTKANATQNKILYWAVGGSQISNAKVTSQAHAGTGSRTYSTTGFEGDIAFFVGAPIGITAASNGAGVSFGVATGSSNRFVTTVQSVSPFPVDCARRQLTTKCIQGATGGNPGTLETDADFTAFTSTGYTLNYSAAATGDQFGALVIEGGLWDIGTFNQATSNGTQQIDITTGRTPRSVLFSTFGDAATTSVLDHMRMSFGLMDGSTEASTWQAFVDAASPNQIAKGDLSDTKVIRTLSGSGTLETEADYSSFQSGSFTLNNTTTDATSRQICYVCLSEEAAGTTPVSETSIHKYNIAANVAQTNIHKYDLIANILRASIHKYDLLNTVPPQTSIHKYDLRQNIAQTSIHKYNLFKNILQTSIHKYSLLQNILQTSIHKYTLLNTIAQTSIHKYNLLVNVLQSSIHKYDIIAIAAVLATLISKYNLSQFVSQTNVHKYNLLAYIAQTSIHKYNLLINILQSNIQKYNILQNIVQNSKHKYDLLQNVARTSIHKYSLLAYALQSSIQKYNLLQYILQNSIHKYDLQVLGAVVNALIAKYNILQYISQTNTHKYNLFQNILQSSVQKYNLLISILQTSIHKYSLLQNVVQASIQKYGILQQILSTSIHKYDILVSVLTVLQSSIHKYHLLNTIAQTSRHKYDILNTVVRTSIHKYDILQQILRNSIHKYSMGGVLTVQSRHVYNIIREILGTSVTRGRARIIPPKLKTIKYPVYHIDELRKIDRQIRLRSTKSTIIPAFKYNIHKTVAPFVVTSQFKNRVTVRFAVARKEPVIFLAKRPLPIQIQGKMVKKEAQKAHSTHVMQQKVIEKYGNRLNKFAKLMKLLLIAEEYDKLKD